MENKVCNIEQTTFRTVNFPASFHTAKSASITRGCNGVNEYKKIVQETLTERDLLEQLAEEAAELSQAALKLIRASGMNKNVTPVSREQAAEAVFEELNDVLIVAEALGIFLGDHKMDSYKWQRWAERVAGNAIGKR